MANIRKGAVAILRGRFPKAYSTGAVLAWLRGGWGEVRRAAVEGF